MASLAAVASQGQQDDVAPFPLLRIVASYLDIEILMPPMRLHWSIILGRPMLDAITVMEQGVDELGPVFIDEVAGLDCLINYRVVNPDTGHRDWHNNVPAVDVMGNRDQCWYVRLIDPTRRDVQFEMEWRA